MYTPGGYAPTGYYPVQYYDTGVVDPGAPPFTAGAGRGSVYLHGYRLDWMNILLLAALSWLVC